MGMLQANVAPCWKANFREIRHAERRDAGTRKVTEGDKDEGSDSRRHQPGQQDHTDESTADPSCLQQQEGTDKW